MGHAERDSGEAGIDWIAFLKESGEKVQEELALNELEQGEAFSATTLNSIYFMRMLDREKRTADLVTNIAGRPQGEIIVNGCTWGRSSSIRPDHLFVGGNLEFSFIDESTGLQMTHTTSDIRELCRCRR